METLQLSQHEIDLLLQILESQDLEETQLSVTDLISLHSKISSLQTY